MWGRLSISSPLTRVRASLHSRSQIIRTPFRCNTRALFPPSKIRWRCTSGMETNGFRSPPVFSIRAPTLSLPRQITSPHGRSWAGDGACTCPYSCTKRRNTENETLLPSDRNAKSPRTREEGQHDEHWRQLPAPQSPLRHRTAWSLDVLIIQTPVQMTRRFGLD